MTIKRVVMTTIVRYQQALCFVFSVLITSYVMVTLAMMYRGQLRLTTESLSSHKASYSIHQLKYFKPVHPHELLPKADSPNRRHNHLTSHTHPPVIKDYVRNQDYDYILPAPNSRDSLPSTKRQNHFVYVNIEKTGSSTFSNIFASYGYRHRLNFMFTKDPRSLLNTSIMEPGIGWDIGPDRERPHIMEQHARYNKKFYDKFFPPNTIYIASIRDPVKWFISFVDFMKIYQLYNPRQVLEQSKLFNLPIVNSPMQMQQYVHNTFLQYFGLDVYKSDNLTAVKHYIDFIDKQFKLVMISDYFDESLVLLKRLMNWSMADIFYKYAIEPAKRSGTIFTYAEKEKLLDDKHNLGDWMLYQHFNKTFWEKISQQTNFFEEVASFRRLKRKVQEFCFSEELADDEELVLEISTTEELIEIRERDCLGIRVRDGKALELSEALDEYCPFRASLRRRKTSKKYSSKKKQLGMFESNKNSAMRFRQQLQDQKGHQQMMQLMQGNERFKMHF